ncbi:MAG: thioredoxin [Nitrososphaeraceae archaeon]
MERDEKVDMSDYNKNFYSSKNYQILELSEKNFDLSIKNQKPLLVDFWATWCGPCKFMLPVFDSLAKKYSSKVNFGRLNVDDFQSIAVKYDVYAIPTFILFANGEVAERAVGAVGEKGLENLLKKYK